MSLQLQTLGYPKQNHFTHSFQYTMADRAQPQQRNMYTAEASAFRPDFKRTYGDDYMRTLSFVSTDTPAHARVRSHHPSLGATGSLTVIVLSRRDSAM